MTDSSIRAMQKRQDAIAAFWARRVSPYLTRVCVRLGISPNQATLIWGAVSAANSYLVYRALTGDYRVLPLIPLVYIFCYVLDCSDGEIARSTNQVNPVAGKLLDGICHRATEYSLLGVFVAAAWTLTHSGWVVPVGVLLLSGDAMYSYVSERRIMALRVHAGVRGHVGRSSHDLYEWGTPWSALTRRQQIGTIAGQLHYKSLYPVIVVSYVSGNLLLGGLALLAAYKHWKWIHLMQRTVAAVSTQTAPATAAVPEDPAAVAANR
jgi:phosphatidylglycerophosphate synthase